MLFFFFQAEDGIRDVRTWLEFRRVLFRSTCSDGVKVIGTTLTTPVSWRGALNSEEEPSKSYNRSCLLYISTRNAFRGCWCTIGGSGLGFHKQTPQYCTCHEIHKQIGHVSLHSSKNILVTIQKYCNISNDGRMKQFPLQKCVVIDGMKLDLAGKYLTAFNCLTRSGNSK